MTLPSGYNNFRLDVLWFVFSTLPFSPASPSSSHWTITLSCSLAGGGQRRSATLAWCHQTFRAFATMSVTSLFSSLAHTTTTGSTRAASSPMWRMTRTLSRVRSTLTKPSRKVISSQKVSSYFKTNLWSMSYDFIHWSCWKDEFLRYCCCAFSSGRSSPAVSGA